jgi:hypothetical protein
MNWTRYLSSCMVTFDLLSQAEVHLNDARRKWSDEVVVDLHEAELAVHRTDYSGAVDILRKASRHYEELWDGALDLKPSQREVMEHIGPSIFSLHGVAEFRVNPESPEVCFVSFLISHLTLLSSLPSAHYLF